MTCRETLRSASGLGGVSGRPRSMLIFPSDQLVRCPYGQAGRPSGVQRAGLALPRGARLLAARLPVSQDQPATTHGTPVLHDAGVTDPSPDVRAPSIPPRIAT